jgi:hypothetical protein
MPGGLLLALVFAVWIVALVALTVLDDRIPPGGPS